MEDIKVKAEKKIKDLIQARQKVIEQANMQINALSASIINVAEVAGLEDLLPDDLKSPVPEQPPANIEAPQEQKAET